MTERFYSAGDYAGLSNGKWAFYYGYEYGRTENDDELWGFRATYDDNVFLEIPDHKREYADSPKSGLMFGIAKALALLPPPLTTHTVSREVTTDDR